MLKTNCKQIIWANMGQWCPQHRDCVVMLAGLRTKGRVGPNCIVESMSSPLSTGRIMKVTLLEAGAETKGRIETQPSGI